MGIRDELRVMSARFADEVADAVTAALSRVVDDSAGAKVNGAKVNGAKVNGAKVNGAKVNGAKVNGAKKSRTKRRSESIEALATAVLAEITDDPGRGVEAIAASMDVPSRDLRLPIKRLIGADQIIVAGQKRGTRYSPATSALVSEANDDADSATA